MKYTRFNHPNKNTITLQGVGHVLGTPASEIKPGDILMWNYGAKETVVSIQKETESFVFVNSQSGNYTGVRRLKKTRLVCVLEK